MAIGSYPRVTVQGTGAANNIQNGLGLMLLNPSTGQYEAATASTFSGGGGGGDATAANQETQIDEVLISNASLADIQSSTASINSNLYVNGQSAAEWIEDVENWTKTTSNSLIAFGKPAAEYLNDIYFVLFDIKNLLTDIKNNQTNGTQRNVIQDTSGNTVNVTANKLNVDTGA